MRKPRHRPGRRFSILRERVEAIKEIWTSDEASYHGEHVDFDRIWCWPKPLTEPHPPIIVGGHGKRVLDRVLAFGDEWMPNRIGDDAKISARIARLRQAGEDAGRGPIPTTLANATTDPEVLELYESAGVHRALFWVAQGDESDLERRLDRIAAGIEAYESAAVASGRAQSCEASNSRPSSERPVSSQVAGPTSMCWVAAWTSRKRRCSGLVS